jgi:DNA invertase Pin-like site-specific DNA recombinase
MKRVALYVRVSTEEQKQGISIDAQINALEAYSKEHGYNVVKIYNDAGISARKSYKKRTSLLELIEDCKRGKIDLILVCKLDRFCRSVKDYYAIIDELNGVPWKAIHEDYSNENTDADGMLRLNLYLSIAQAEADKTSDRIKRTFDYKLKNGEYVGGNKAPIGYTRDGKKFRINEDEKEGVEAFFRTYLATFSISKAISSASAHGVNMNIHQAQRVLFHPAHYGALPYVSETFITKEEHDIIEKAKQKTKNYNKYDYIFSGLLICGKCKHNMVAHRRIHNRKDGKQTHTIRYTCKNHNDKMGCSGTSINEKTLENYLLNNVELLLKEYNYSVKTSQTKSDTKRISNIEKRLDRIKVLYEFGDIELEEYKAKRTTLLSELEQLKGIQTVVSELPSDWRTIYDSLDIKHKRAFWYKVLKRIQIDDMKCEKPILFF